MTTAEFPSWLLTEKLRLRGRRKETLRELIDFLKTRQGGTRELAECLLGKRDSVLDPQVCMGALVAEIAGEVPRQSRDDLLTLLGRAVDCRNQRHPYPLPLPHFPVTMPRPIPPFTPECWPCLANYAIWSDAVLADIAHLARCIKRPGVEEISCNDLRVRVARVMASAVLWGGVLSRRRLQVNFTMLPIWATASEFIHDRLYVTWRDPDHNYHRWQPDVITTLLLLELRPAQREQLTTLTTSVSLERVVIDYFGTIIPDRTARPRRLSDLLDASLLFYQLRVPAWVTEIAAGRQPSTSPDPLTWARIVKSASSHLTVRAKRDAEVEENEPEINGMKVAGQGEGDWLLRLRAMLGSAKPNQTNDGALRSINRYLREPGLNHEERLFASFAVDALRTRSNDRLRSIRESVIAIASRLPALLDMNKPGSLSAESLSGAYRLILDDATGSSQHRKLRLALSRWHHWLEFQMPNLKIDGREVFGSSRGGASVDSQLVLEDEYLKCRDFLISPEMNFSHDPGGHKELLHIAGLILILGYRCGLRKYEVLKAQLDALLVDESGIAAEFRVRPWSERKLKTPNAIRKLPLYALLEPEEVDLLIQWQKHRHLQENQARLKSPFLFHCPAVGRRCIPESRIFPRIHDVLRKVTKDDRVHFHILRKSGAGTWLAFALLRPANSSLPVWLKDCPAQKDRLERTSSLHRNLYGNEFITRRHLFSVARTLGHSTPGTSSAVYLELQNELLALWMEQEAPQLGPKHIQALGKICPQTASKYRAADARQSLWKAAGERWKEISAECTFPLTEGTQPQTVERPLTVRKRFEEALPQKMLAIDKILSAHAGGADQQQLMREYKCSMAFLNVLTQLAKDAADLTVSEEPRGGKRPVGYVHRFIRIGNCNQACMPAPLRTAPEIEFIEAFGSKVFEYAADNQTSFRLIANHWLQSRRDGRHGLEFGPWQAGIAQRYLEFLAEIGIRPEQCSILHFGSDQQVDDWKKCLKLSDDWWTRLAPARPVKTKAEHNLIGVKVLNLADKESAGSTSDVYGWRYLMLMVSLWASAR